MVVDIGRYSDRKMIEGSPITVCRVCGYPYSSVVMAMCDNCDRAAWELCQKIDDAKRIVIEKAVENASK